MAASMKERKKERKIYIYIYIYAGADLRILQGGGRAGILRGGSRFSERRACGNFINLWGVNPLTPLVRQCIEIIPMMKLCEKESDP